MQRQAHKYILPLLLGVFMLVAEPMVWAQTSPVPLNAEEKSQLQQQLTDIENQIIQYQNELKQITGQKNTLQNKIKLLKKQQATLNLQIQATNLQITDIKNKLTETEAVIEQNTAKIAILKQRIGSLMKTIYQNGNYSLLYLLVSQDNLSDILSELQHYSQISDSLRILLDLTKQTNADLNQEQDALAQQKEDSNNFLTIQNLQKQQLTGTVSQQNSLLSETKGKESNYQAIISDTQKQAASIRNRLYQLLGVSTQITFGQAVEIATWASGQTGVRVAFLLAILTQESNLGKNVGTCNRPGDPPNKSYKVIMKPDRDIQPFLQITADLGMDPEVTPVSCPMKNKDGSFNGWGGAMGPAQFIPSTWMGYKDKVTAITGKFANPWDIRDAFLASAIKLKAGGAGTVAGEWAAAMRYFSGGTNTKYRFYGDNVVNMTNQYQNDIDNLSK